ncbi:hypothetical protein [Mesorhizobium sp. M1217]|uniref:hypothetical protein n=1 Tax=Mesorhizobium sp. M1217 TaxID=2957070 RepID=UPI00333845CA
MGSIAPGRRINSSLIGLVSRLSWSKDSIAGLDDQGKCSFSVLMAHDPIDTLGKATRHNMLVKAECSCGNVRYCRSADLMMVYAGRPQATVKSSSVLPRLHWPRPVPSDESRILAGDVFHRFQQGFMNRSKGLIVGAGGR